MRHLTHDLAGKSGHEGVDRDDMNGAHENGADHARRFRARVGTCRSVAPGFCITSTPRFAMATKLCANDCFGLRVGFMPPVRTQHAPSVPDFVPAFLCSLS